MTAQHPGKREKRGNRFSESEWIRWTIARNVSLKKTIAHFSGSESSLDRLHASMAKAELKLNCSALSGSRT